MKIVWSPEAIEDLISLRAYIAEDDPAAAQRVVLRIVQNIEQLLPDNPHIGRAGRNVSTILRQSCLVFRLGVLSAGSVD